MATSSVKPTPKNLIAKIPSTEKVEYRPPVIKVTQYEKVWAFLVALVLALIVAVVWLAFVYSNTVIPKEEEAVPLELLEMPGGFEDGVPDETLQLDSPEEVTYDPSTAEIEQDESEITEVEDVIQEISENASIQADEQFVMDAQNAGKPGSATGSGRRPLGSGDGKSGLPREQRWFISFAERGTLDTYAKQLSYFGIELGVLLPTGKLVYLSNLTKKPPTTRSVSSGKSEKRLYMTWQGGARKKADVDLFKRANIDVSRGTLFQFYPPRTEAMLARLEKSYRNKPTSSIKRTYFVVRSAGNGYKFVVTRQSYLIK
ncbi:hypothetical protein MNBD_PLANCTO02-2757 [hydrothermal vent metagenome]|uniref:Uncharacterized protein n=1 Tax=hydrothermal vent metagenome TaxID=652676 RepID=A0A3B1DRA2_9ZZZZ